MSIQGIKHGMTTYYEFVLQTGRFFHFAQDTQRIAELHVREHGGDHRTYTISRLNVSLRQRESTQLTGLEILKILREEPYWSEHFRSGTQFASLGHRARAIYGFSANPPRPPRRVIGSR